MAYFPIAGLHCHCRFTTYRHRFARVAPAPRAKLIDSKNRGRASPVNIVKLAGLRGSSLRFQQSLGTSGNVKPARLCISLALRAPYGTLHTCASKAPCPNVQPCARTRVLLVRQRAAQLLRYPGMHCVHVTVPCFRAQEKGTITCTDKSPSSAPRAAYSNQSPSRAPRAATRGA